MNDVQDRARAGRAYLSEMMLQHDDLLLLARCRTEQEQIERTWYEKNAMERPKRAALVCQARHSYLSEYQAATGAIMTTQGTA